MDSDDELQTILMEQSQELAAAKALESDLDFAFQLQMQEAMNISVAIHQSPSSSTPPQFQFVDGDTSDTSFVASLVAEEIARFEQERSDREHAEAEMRLMRENLDRQIHDQSFARDLSRIADDEWAKTGDHFVRPYGDGSSSSVAVIPKAEPLGLYFKGLVREDTVRGTGKMSAGLGIAICDVKNYLIFEMRKPLFGGIDLSPEVAEVKALILGLDAAISLGIKRLTFFCADNFLLEYISGKWIPMQGNIATLVNQVTLLQSKFTYCTPSFVRQKDIKFALTLANEALVFKVTLPEVSTSSVCTMETCRICLEDTKVGKMFSIRGCMHRYCYSCTNKHAEVKLLQGMLPKCPHNGCKTDLTIEMCKQLLTPEFYEIMTQRVKESTIAAKDKIYCPYPRCSALMSRTEVMINTRVGRPSKCTRCRGLFCIYCKVPWHKNMSCAAYLESNPYPCAEDAKLKSLARKNQWRQCVKCSHMVELAVGCNHIYCRCGYQFCYICGAEWRNKKATCSCPLWDEHRIIYDVNDRGQRRRIN